MISSPTFNNKNKFIETTTTNDKDSGRTIWAFWDGNPPDLVLRCIESMRIKNPTRPVIVVSRATLSFFLEPSDFPTFGGRPGTPEDFSSPQYLSDWVRLTLLEKYGGVWFDASTICTGPVEEWISSDPNHITMFPMHANEKIHGNWTMASPRPGHPLLKAWRNEFAAVVNAAGPRQVPVNFCKQAFIEYPALKKIWFHPRPPPLPYLWVYLVLQVVLQKQPSLHDTICLRPSIDGPMYRRYYYNIVKKITDNVTLSQCVADDLATKPLSLESHDYGFIKLVGADRGPCQHYLTEGTFQPNSVLAWLHCLSPRPVIYGVNLQEFHDTSSKQLPSLALQQFRAAVYAVMVARSVVTRTNICTREENGVIAGQAMDVPPSLADIQRRASVTRTSFVL